MATSLQFTQEQQAFIDKALQIIEMNANNRINIPARNVLSRNNFVFDAHSHIFDGHCVDADYMIIRLLNLSDKPLARKLVQFIIRKLLPHQAENLSLLKPKEILEAIYAKKSINEICFEDSDIEAFEEELEEEEAKEMKLAIDWGGLLKRIKEVIAILKSGEMRFVYDYFTKHAINNYCGDKELISIQLGMDLESGWKGSLLKGFKKQADELLHLSTEVPILPYLPIHPERAKIKLNKETNEPYEFNELYDSFIHYFKAGTPTFFGVKCYPSLGYHPASMALAPIFEVCELAQIPVLTHCGGEIISTFETEIKTDIFDTPLIINNGSRKGNAAQLNHPLNWEPVLKEFPELHLNLAHFGSNSAWLESEEIPHPKVSTIIRFMETYPHVYSDFSFNLSDAESTNIFVKYLSSTDHKYRKIKDRTMYGTDFWVVVPQSNLKKDQKAFLNLTEGFHDKLLVENVINYLGINLNTFQL